MNDGFEAQMEQIVTELERAGVVRPNETPLETVRRLLAFYQWVPLRSSQSYNHHEWC